ncbi:5'-methylthioadenosine/S-adenosylhomocysteine nucleosidase [Arcanobacterium phocisimile]|uniref:adenosylhomocysteine nucleosidase n=1 Tax=Arcanobacterium phocisimile TaxID=1302235 RepID=A0ABX7IIA9_9ACTO|nr:5'-methylthioadenosine/S-adenosylhomocysteine nucleosidase [Arcanobacterium phocisimile]QRV02274.1 5'-methylthioadenosine/S-adenosylhomocysteine nucleosidase [Arcanobacterium phocisimile]
MKNIDALVISAMPEEMAPFLELIQTYNPKPAQSPIGTFYLASRGSTRMALMVTGVGMSACSSALGWALSQVAPKIIVSIGSAGGLARDSRVGQVVVGDEYINGGADGTVFGYARGQVPGQPASFTGDTHMLDSVREVMASVADSFSIRIGQMLSSDAFVTERNVTDTREAFPYGLSADMESHAAAQVAHTWGIPFVSIRGISDLCGDPDDQNISFHAELSDVARRAAAVACQTLQHSKYISLTRCTTQQFSQTILTGALYMMLARRYNLDAGDTSILGDYNLSAESPDIDKFDPDIIQVILGQVAAGKELAQTEPNSALTAKDYDRLRTEFIERLPEDLRIGTFTWPPTSQTIIKRFDGYWNEALSAIGLVPRQGRSRGGIKYSEEDYQTAILAYKRHAAAHDSQPSFAGYSAFAKSGPLAGKIPSGAAVRQHYGSWTNALNSVSADS